MSSKKELSRREFLELSALVLGGMALRGRGASKRLMDWLPTLQEETPEFPANRPLGRICVGEPGAHVDLKSEPYWDAPKVATAWFDDVFEWKKEVIESQTNWNLINQRWVETPDGYIYADYVQKVYHEPQQPLEELPESSNGKGMWVEITTPYFNLSLTKPKESYQYWIKEVIRPRIYYSQVFWAFDVRKDPENGKTQYCLMQLYGAFEDSYWVDAEICRRITPEEIKTIHPWADNKHIIVNLNYQTLSCFEGDEEVFFTKVSTGIYDRDEGHWWTPLGKHTIWRKLISTHMSAEAGVSGSGFDVPGIPWTAVFGTQNGEALHSTYWHNYFGTARSHGCVNLRPDDAKWIWRWIEPATPYDPGEIYIQGLNKSTQVEVVEI